MTDTKKPVQPKVKAATAGVALVTVAVWVASLFGVEVPTEVAGAFSTIAAFAGGWVKK